MNCKNEPVSTVDLSDLPADNLESLPDEFLGIRKLTDPINDTTDYSFVRVPTAKIFPWANMDNKIALNPNNAELEVPDRQVLAGKVVSYGNSVTIEKAGADDAVHFLLLGRVDDRIIAQNCGFIIMPDGHDYIVGTPYYAGENGVPTTTAGGARLFTPISSTVLAVNIVNGA